MWKTEISHRARINAKMAGNTRSDFEELLAFDPGANCETDARLSQLGTVFVCHDNCLPNGTWLNTLDWAPGVLELHELFQLFRERGNGQGIIYLELKNGPGDRPGVLPQVLEVARQYPNQPLAFSSFDNRILEQVPLEFPIGILSNMVPREGIAAYLSGFTARGRSLATIAYHPDINNLPDDVRDAVLAMGITINPYTAVARTHFPMCWQYGMNPITDEFEAAREFAARKRLESTAG